MALSDIMTALLTPLQAIPDIGHVYPYDRIALEPTSLNGVMGPLPALRYWCLSRAGTAEVWRGNGERRAPAPVAVAWVPGAGRPAGQRARHQDLLDAVFDTLNAVVTIPGSAEYVTAPTLERQEPRRLADTVDVHFSETFVVASEYLQVDAQDVPDDTSRRIAPWVTGSRRSSPPSRTSAWCIPTNA